MEGVDFIIFSKNRPMQLRALLESMHNYIDVKLVNSIGIVFTFDPLYEEGYKNLSIEFPDINWIKESNFRDQSIRLVNESKNFVCFLVDDIIFFNPVSQPINPFAGEVCFSLRLGKNSKYSHPANSWYESPDFKESEFFVSWDWKKSSYDFGYPFSLDGHVFFKSDILPVLESIQFRNPNSLENGLMYFNPFMNNFVGKKMRSFLHSCLVGIPVNRVNNEVPNRYGLSYSINESELQNKFSEGYRIAWEEMDFTSIIGPHQEIEYQFKQIKHQ